MECERAVRVCKQLVVSVGYFGDRGTHLANLVDTNYVTSLGPGNINPRRRFKSVFIPLSIAGAAGPVSGVTISPWRRLPRQENTGNTIFHSMQAKVEHRFANGFTILASWIWSKGLGDIRGSSPEGAAPGSTYQNPANLRQERGYLDTQVAHSFVSSEIMGLALWTWTALRLKYRPSHQCRSGGLECRRDPDANNRKSV